MVSRLILFDAAISYLMQLFLTSSTDFSQQVCNEYMKFFNFEGLSVDDALRSVSFLVVIVV